MPSSELPRTESDNELTATTVKTQLMLAVRQLLGSEGAKYKVDILKFNRSERKFILRCDSEQYIRLRAALTLANIFEGKPCVYNIIKDSPNLHSLIVNRTYNH